MFSPISRLTNSAFTHLESVRIIGNVCASTLTDAPSKTKNQPFGREILRVFFSIVDIVKPSWTEGPRFVRNARTTWPTVNERRSREINRQQARRGMGENKLPTTILTLMPLSLSRLSARVNSTSDDATIQKFKPRSTEIASCVQ